MPPRPSSSSASQAPVPVPADPAIIDDPAFSVAAAGDGFSQALEAPLPALKEDAGVDDVASQQAEAVEAAYGAASRQWKGIPLAPFAISREADWRQHRTALRCMPLEDLIADPQALLPDALRVLWFLAHDPAEWLGTPSMQQVDADTPAARWVRRPAFEMALEVERKVRAWADEHISSAEHALAVQFFYDVFNSTQTCRTTVVPDKHRNEAKAKK